MGSRSSLLFFNLFSLKCPLSRLIKCLKCRSICKRLYVLVCRKDQHSLWNIFVVVKLLWLSEKSDRKLSWMDAAAFVIVITIIWYGNDELWKKALYELNNEIDAEKVCAICCIFFRLFRCCFFGCCCCCWLFVYLSMLQDEYDKGGCLGAGWFIAGS